MTLAEIRELLEKATPGPWDNLGYIVGWRGDRCLSIVQ